MVVYYYWYLKDIIEYYYVKVSIPSFKTKR